MLWRLLMKVLLADDNPLILERFARMADWNACGFDTVLTAMDGKMALKQFDQHTPELVITDIQMPRMTGIQLAESILARAPRTVIYFLSSYEEFSYVKAGMDLGIRGYLLKHETTKETLQELLGKVSLEIQAKRLQNRYTAEAALQELLDTLDASRRTDHPDLQKFTLSLSGSYDLLWLEQDCTYPPFAEFFQLPPERIESRTVIQACYQAFPETAAVICIGEAFACLLHACPSVTETAYQLKKNLCSRFHVSFSVLILADQTDISGCAFRYQHTDDIRKQTIFRPVSSLYHASYISHSRSITAAPDLKKADQYFRERDFDNLCRWMDQNFLQTIEAKDPARFDTLTRYVLSRLQKYRKLPAAALTVSGHSSAPADFSCWQDASLIYQWLKQRITDLAQTLDEPSSPQYSTVINQAIQYIYRNYSNCDLSLESMADSLGISANYLNTVFRRETGETLWKLVVRIRMERARELLSLGQDKMTDICCKTGYKNMSYFSKVFRETYGMTPMQYRRDK